MIIRTFHPPNHPEHWFTDPFRDKECFYCLRPLTVPVIVWHGAGDPIGLHPGCTVELSIRLFRDVHEIECGPYGYVTDPISRLRVRLIAEEHTP